MLTTIEHPAPPASSPAINDDEQPGEVNWQRLRNAIRKRLRHHVRTTGRNWGDLDDMIQDACGFAFQSIQRGTPAGLAIFRAVGRAKRGQTLTYEPHNRASWEESFDPSRSANGVGAATRRAAAGLPLHGFTALR
jgi:hypothetical protein